MVDRVDHGDVVDIHRVTRCWDPGSVLVAVAENLHDALALSDIGGESANALLLEIEAIEGCAVRLHELLCRQVV